MEKHIEAYLVRKVKDLGGVAYKFVSPANRGVSDRVVALGSSNSKRQAVGSHPCRNTFSQRWAA
jgi:hypothetical protein